MVYTTHKLANSSLAMYLVTKAIHLIDLWVLNGILERSQVMHIREQMERNGQL